MFSLMLDAQLWRLHLLSTQAWNLLICRTIFVFALFLRNGYALIHRAWTNRDGNGITHDGAIELSSVLKLKNSGLVWLSMVQLFLLCHLLIFTQPRTPLAGQKCSWWQRITSSCGRSSLLAPLERIVSMLSVNRLSLWNFIADDWRCRYVHSCGISPPGACALIEAAALSKQLCDCHIGGNEFQCISDLVHDVAWNSSLLPLPPLQVLPQFDHAFATSLAGNVRVTVSWVRRYCCADAVASTCFCISADIIMPICSEMSTGRFGLCECGRCPTCESSSKNAEILKCMKILLFVVQILGGDCEIW